MVGTADLERPDFDKAKALLKESGYDARPVIFMQPSDLAANFNATVVVADGMRKAGFKVDVQPLDWGTPVAAPQQQGPGRRGQQGRLNLFITVATALDASTPLTNPYLAPRAPTTSPASPVTSWWESTDEAEPAKLADQIQVRAYQVVPYFNGGQWKQYTAVRTNVSGAGGDDVADVPGGGEGGVRDSEPSIILSDSESAATDRSSRLCMLPARANSSLAKGATVQFLAGSIRIASKE
jgi:peptide/nickel transport system substrate-binding protein